MPASRRSARVIRSEAGSELDNDGGELDNDW
jgi:hypothetical protein